MRSFPGTTRSPQQSVRERLESHRLPIPNEPITIADVIKVIDQQLTDEKCDSIILSRAQAEYLRLAVVAMLIERDKLRAEKP
jgi:hypothetical protein